jgi:arabinogalactan endo-1,4-beta-galactosidase
MILKKITGVLGLAILVFGIESCKKSGDNEPTPVPKDTAFFAKGADISWLTQMESSGLKFYDSAGIQQDCLQVLKGVGINSIRLRAWVNPADGWNNTTDVVAKAIRAKNMGMKILIDLHYSDTWADPGHQTKPAAWANLSFADLKTAVYNYTVGVMDTLKLNGVTPTWVQVGNETDDGMLWPTGQVSQGNMANYAALVKMGYTAVKSVSTSTKVIVHLSNGYDNSHFTSIFNGLMVNGTSWDIIGLSLYPSFVTGGYSTADPECLANMTSLVAQYSTPVMIVEVGFPENQASIAKGFLSDIITKTKSISGDQGLGVFYWEPESYNGWQGYGLGAFDDSGKPTTAMDAFKGN